MAPDHTLQEAAHSTGVAVHLRHMGTTAHERAELTGQCLAWEGVREGREGGREGGEGGREDYAK